MVLTIKLCPFCQVPMLNLEDQQHTLVAFETGKAVTPAIPLVTRECETCGFVASFVEEIARS